MSSAFNKTARDLAQTLKQIGSKSTSPYDTSAEVRRIEGDTAWVHIPGGVDETPVQLTTNAKKGDIVLDLFFGSGTSGIEAINMERRCIGVELKDDLAESVSEKFNAKQLVTDVNIICADSASELAKEKIKARLDIMGEKKAQLLMLHPPYDDIIKFSDKKEDLSNCATTEEFYDLFEKVAKNGYDLLEKGRFACLIIGDKYANSQHIPLGFECMARMNKIGFITKAIIIKDMQGNERAKGKTANLWRYRALAGGFYIFKHEYVMIFQKA